MLRGVVFVYSPLHSYYFRVTLWDINKSGKTKAEQVAYICPHVSGIFSLHELGGKVITGSKVR